MVLKTRNFRHSLDYFKITKITQPSLTKIKSILQSSLRSNHLHSRVFSSIMNSSSGNASPLAELVSTHLISSYKYVVQALSEYAISMCGCTVQ